MFTFKKLALRATESLMIDNMQVYYQSTILAQDWTECAFSSQKVSRFLGKYMWGRQSSTQWKTVPRKAISPVWIAMLPNSLCYHSQDWKQPLLPPTNSRHQAMRPTLQFHKHTCIPISWSPWAAPSYGCVSQRSHTSTLVADARPNLIFNSMRLLS